MLDIVWSLQSAIWQIKIAKDNNLGVTKNSLSRTVLIAITPLITLFAVVACNVAAEGLETVDEFKGKVNAPDFPMGLQWLNTENPISLRELRGKVVLLDFWTYCCINCMHVIPDLKRLEKKYADELVVIGVHSAKFTTEKEIGNIRQAILRYEIEHPVVNDSRMTMWRAYGVRAWPTLVLIDPEGNIVGARSGEGVYEPFDEAISKVIENFETQGKLDRSPLKLKLEKENVQPTLLSFPGKVLADETSDKLFISDSNNNRIVVLSLSDYSVIDIVGSGETDLVNGGFDEAAFNHPQGMAFDGEFLYVADTENHTIRKVDFKQRIVMTIAGTGKQSRRFNVPGPALQTALNSPWDLVIHKEIIYIAMAGSHQIWTLDLGNGIVAPYAGSGREARVDGPLAGAALAQPSGITTDGKRIYFADSEVSSIRSADIAQNGSVRTIAGGDLFDFGDVDDIGLRARFQHPLGVVYHEGTLYIADTYNNKIKKITLSDSRSKTFLGKGKEGMQDGLNATFDEPGGVSIAGNRLFIADTNNHAIRVADLKSRTVKTLVIKDMERLKPVSPALDDIEEEIWPEQVVGIGKANLKIDLELPYGMKLSDLAVSSVAVAFREADSTYDKNHKVIENPEFPIIYPFEIVEGQGTATIDYSIYYCSEGNEGLCYFREGRIKIPLGIDVSKGNMPAKVTIKIP